VFHHRGLSGLNRLNAGAPSRNSPAEKGARYLLAMRAVVARRHPQRKAQEQLATFAGRNSQDQNLMRSLERISLLDDLWNDVNELLEERF
jgi:hypothetical protein